MANVLAAVNRKEEENSREIEKFLVEAKDSAVRQVFG